MFVPFVPQPVTQLLKAEGDQLSRDLAKGDESTLQLIRDKSALAWTDEQAITYIVTGETWREFAKRTGLVIRSKSVVKTGKRLRRLIRPHKFSAFVKVGVHENNLDPKTYDGFGFINEEFLQSFFGAYALQNDPTLTPSAIAAACAARRFNLTYVDGKGQLKGHVVAVPASTFPGKWVISVPAESYKTEIAIWRRTPFLALEPVHSKRFPKMDLQSLINMNWVTPDMAQPWIAAYAAKLVDALRERELNPLSILDDWLDEHTMDRYMSWWLGEYLARGGRLSWFRTTMQAMVNTMRSQFRHMVENVRLPFPGWYVYIAPLPPQIGELKPGHARVDTKHATLWVHPETYREHMEILGGCDGDDAVWVVPIDGECDANEYLLAWRSPNQPGEYMLVKNAAIRVEPALGPVPHISQVRAGLRPRIDQSGTQYLYESLPGAEVSATYSATAVTSAFLSLRGNVGALGSYCNVLMAFAALTQRPPRLLPVPLEVVIDGTVKAPLDLEVVKTWCALQREFFQQYKTRKKLPVCLQVRFGKPEWAQLTEHRVDQIQVILDAATPTLEAVLDDLQVTIAGPVALANTYAGSAYAEAAAQAASTWHITYHKMLLAPDLRVPVGRTKQSVAAEIADQMLADRLPDITQEPQRIAACALFEAESSDKTSNWLTRPTMWPYLVDGLMELGLLGDVVWNESTGAYLYLEEELVDETPVAHTVRVNGVWFNWLKTRVDVENMSDVEPEVRADAKTTVARIAGAMQGRLVDVRLTPDGDRLVMYGPSGSLIGFVAVSTPVLIGQYEIVQVLSSDDGNWTLTIAPEGDGDAR